MGEHIFDYYGNVIEEGDYISYPFRKGSVLGTRTAKINKIETRFDHLGYPETIAKVTVVTFNERSQPVKKRTCLTRLEKVVVLPKSYIQNDLFSSCLMKNEI